MDSFEVSTVLPSSPQEVYEAWLDSEKHTEMTGGGAEVSDEVGGAFQTWDNYITGRNLELDPNKRILQAWRTSEFADDEEDSIVEVLLEETGASTRLTLKHSMLPKHGRQYEQGWIDNYFDPMLEYFSR